MKPDTDAKVIPNQSRDLPPDALYNIFSLLRVNDVPIIARVSKNWNAAVKEADLLKTMAHNSIPKGIPIRSFTHEEKDAKIIFTHYERKRAAAKRFIAERAIVQEVEVEIADMKANNQIAAEMGIEGGGYGVCRCETCAATCGGAVGGTGLWALVSYFVCKEVACIFGFVGCITSTPLSFWGSSYYFERRAQAFREQEAGTHADIGSPLLNAVEREAVIRNDVVAVRDDADSLNVPRPNAP